MVRPMLSMLLSMVVVVLVSTGSPSLAAESEFRPLFNGKSLDGWIQPDLPGLFFVEDGKIVGITDGSLEKNEFLVTEERFSDFELTVSLRVISGNSGIQFRSERLDNGAVRGPQADAAEPYWGLLYEERGRGILERYPEEKVAEIVDLDGFNTYVIRCVGDQLTITLNGTTVIERVDPEFAADGIIALQVHVGPAMRVEFKDIRIKQLNDSESAE